MSSDRQGSVTGVEPAERIKQTIDSVSAPEGRLRQPVPPGAFDRPAIGLVIGEGSADGVAGTVLRANRAGHHVLVTLGAAPDVEALDFAHDLGATVVDSGFSSDDPVQRLSSAARDYGFPGLVYQNGTPSRIDIEESVGALRRSARFAMEAAAAPGDVTTSGVVVGIPVYNEALSIGSVVVDASRYADDVVVVDDGSTDDTTDIAREAGATVVAHDENQGKGAAVRTLLEHVRGMEFEALVLLDGDGQHAPRDIPGVVEAVTSGEGDVVIGSRYLDGRAHDTPRYRRVGQRVLDALTVGSSRTRVTDSQSGFRALSPEAVERLSLRSNGYGVETEMIESAAREGLSVVETPIDVRYDVDGSSENPFRHGLAVVMFVVQLVRDRHPLVFFGLPGCLLTAFGIAYGIDGILTYQATGAFYPAKAMVSGFTTIVGVLGVFLGLVLNSFANHLARVDDEQGQ